MRNFYSQDEISFLQKNYIVHGAAFCSKALGRTSKSLNSKARHLGLRIPHHKVVELRKLGCVRANNYYEVNPERFYKVEMAEVAYFLGFLWADGHIKIRPVKGGNQYTFAFTILYTDYLCIKSVLNKIGKWRLSIKKINLSQKRPHHIADVRTGNMPLVVYLVKHDFQIKSFVSPTKILATIPDHLKHYFWRGYMDGDGSIHVGKSSAACIAGTLSQNWQDIQELFSALKIVYRTVRRPTVKGGGSVVIMSSCEDIYKWGKYIYNGYEQDGIGLSRKYNRWKEIEKKYIRLESIRNLILDEPRNYLKDITRLLTLIIKYNGRITRGKILQHFRVDRWTLSKEAKRLCDLGKIRVNAERWPSPYVVI